MSREDLEQLALAEVCSCRYYDLQDTLQESPDSELLALVDQKLPCEICGR